MNRPRYVLDASALLCVLFDEDGADRVAERINGALLSATGYAEIVGTLADRGMPADEIAGVMADLDIEIVPVDRRQAEIAGLMRAPLPAAFPAPSPTPPSADVARLPSSHLSARHLSLGARACLALALDRGAIAVTADRSWTRLDIGVVVEAVR